MRITLYRFAAIVVALISISLSIRFFKRGIKATKKGLKTTKKKGKKGKKSIWS